MTVAALTDAPICIFFKSLGVKCLAVDGICDDNDATPKYDATCVRGAIDAILEQGSGDN